MTDPRRLEHMRPDDTDIEQVRQFAIEQAADAAEYRMRLRYLERENAKLSRRLSKVYTSWTWRTGRVVLFPYHVLTWLLGKRKRSAR